MTRDEEKRWVEEHVKALDELRAFHPIRHTGFIWGCYVCGDRWRELQREQEHGREIQLLVSG